MMIRSVSLVVISVRRRATTPVATHPSQRKEDIFCQRKQSFSFFEAAGVSKFDRRNLEVSRVLPARAEVH